MNKWIKQKSNQNKLSLTRSAQYDYGLSSTQASLSLIVNCRMYNVYITHQMNELSLNKLRNDSPHLLRQETPPSSHSPPPSEKDVINIQQRQVFPPLPLPTSSSTDP